MEKTTGEYGDNQFWSKPTNDFDLDELMADMDWISVDCVCSRCAKNNEQLTLIHMLALPWESLRSLSLPWLRKPATARLHNLAVLWALSTLTLWIRKFALRDFLVQTEKLVISVPIVPFTLILFEVWHKNTNNLSSQFFLSILSNFLFLIIKQIKSRHIILFELKRSKMSSILDSIVAPKKSSPEKPSATTAAAKQAPSILDSFGSP